MSIFVPNIIKPDSYYFKCFPGHDYSTLFETILNKEHTSKILNYEYDKVKREELLNVRDEWKPRKQQMIDSNEISLIDDELRLLNEYINIHNKKITAINYSHIILPEYARQDDRKKTTLLEERRELEERKNELMEKLKEPERIKKEIEKLETMRRGILHYEKELEDILSRIKHGREREHSDGFYSNKNLAIDYELELLTLKEEKINIEESNIYIHEKRRGELEEERRELGERRRELEERRRELEENRKNWKDEEERLKTEKEELRYYQNEMKQMERDWGRAERIGRKK